MAITIDEVLNHLRRDEPDYTQAARLGDEAVPHLMTLLQGTDVGLAARAAFLAGTVDTDRSLAVVELAAKHPAPVVRVAAAAAARHVTRVPTALLRALLNDADVGVRKWALKAIEVHRLQGTKAEVAHISQHDPDPRLRDRASRMISLLP